MDKQRQDDQLIPIYNSSVPIEDIALKIYQERWIIKMDGEKESGRPVLAVRHDDDDDDVQLYFIIIEKLTATNFLRFLCVIYYNRMLSKIYRRRLKEKRKK